MEKLQRANYTFNYITDSALITKMNLFDIDAFFQVVGVIPSFIAAPLSLYFNIKYVVYTLELWTYSWILSIVFGLAAWGMLNLNGKIAKLRLKMNIIISERAMIFKEMVPNMVKIKLHSLENLFIERLHKNR